MRIVCLSNLQDGSGYVVRRVADVFPAARIVQVVNVPRQTTWARSLISGLRGGWLRQLERRLYYREYFRRGEARLEKMLYGPLGVPPLAPVARIGSQTVNHSSTVTLLQSLRPDVLLVVGAPLLKPRVFEIPRLAAINVHFGIAPEYRGEYTLFWPVYYRDPERLGVTVHLIDKGIDTGRVLGQAFLGVSPHDDEWDLEAKAAQMAADLVITILSGGQFRPCWRRESADTGRLFPFRRRRIWHDVAWNYRRSHGELLPETAPRVVNYCLPPAEACDEDESAAEALTAAAH